jgi:succinyl-diaminopimelate desuccinylase
MPDAVVSQLHAWLRAHESELLDDYRDLLKIPSLESEPLPNAPFGSENRRALDFALSLGRKWGMGVTDSDGYCGWADFGSGDRQIASFGHLDVVPVGPGWKHDPFGAEIDDGYVYARGAVDDKGPTMASFYAMRAIQQVCPNVPATMRQWFGCNEESGFGCIAHYAARYPAPTYGVAPDSGWPLYHGEKGIANLVVERPLVTGDLELLEVSGGQRPNIVIDLCTARVRVAEPVRAEVEAKLAEAWDRNVTTRLDGGDLTVEARGKAAHGAWPIGGDNAAVRCFRFLREIAPVSCQKAYSELLEVGHIGGDGVGVAGSDEPSGALTANLGIVETVGGKVRLTVNCRYPVSWTGQRLVDQCRAKLAKLSGGFELASSTDSKPLYFPLDHPLVSTVCDVYREETGEDKEPGVMGGGTYARAIGNTVSIGTGWDGDGDAHETDERLAIESLFKMSRIYAHILWRLANLPA